MTTNTFKSSTSQSIGSTPVTIYTVPAATTTTVIGLTIGNRVSNSVNATVSITKSGGSLTYLVKGAPVPAGSALVPIGGDQKMVLQTGDIIQVSSDTATSLDAILSYLEMV